MDRDPFDFAPEGAVAESEVERPEAGEDDLALMAPVLAALKTVANCEGAALIGEVRREPPGMVLVETSFGGRRVMDQLVGDPLPRIC